MRTACVVLTCLGVATPAFQAASATYEGLNYIETQLCTTGRIIRIPLGGPVEKDAPDHQAACHAICSRDHDDGEETGAR